MSDERYELPEGWAWATVGDLVVDAQSGFASGKKGVEGGIRHLRMNNIGPDCRLDLSEVTKVPGDLAKERHVLKPGDVLFCHTNSQKLVGKTALFDVEDGPYAYSNHLTRLRLPRNGSPPQWLWYSLAMLWRDRYFETRCKQWVNQATVERHTLLSTPIPVASLKEQRRIVAKIEALFEQSRSARQALDRIPPLLKKFRQSVLAAAFRGDLTRDWREQNPDVESASGLLERIRAERRRRWEEDLRAKGKDPHKVKCEEPKPVDTLDLPHLPEGWVWVGLGQLVARSQNGLSTRFSQTGTPIPVLRLADIRNGRIATEGLRLIRLSDREIQKYSLARCDFLVIRVNGSKELVGRAILFNVDGTFTYCDHFIRYSLFSQEALPDLIALYLDTKRARDHIQFSLVSSAGQNTVSQSSLAALPIPLLPLPEQRQIFARIEELFSHADAIEAAVEAARRQADKLEQSILARAFRGELVSQDPNDEPASTLLDRIRDDAMRSSTTERPTISRRKGKGRQNGRRPAV